ncbi:hypothetical protein GCM10027033_04000 [Leucobacter ruminantium]
MSDFWHDVALVDEGYMRVGAEASIRILEQSQPRCLDFGRYHSRIVPGAYDIHGDELEERWLELSVPC